MDLQRLLNGISELGLNLQLPDNLLLPAAPAFLGVQAGQSLNHVTAYGEVLKDLDFTNAGQFTIQNALKRIGSTINDDANSPLPENTFCYKTRAGWFNLNPALICVIPKESNSLQVIAFAFEGLISQKTAQKALLRFTQALTALGIGYTSENLIPAGRLDDLRLD